MTKLIEEKKEIFNQKLRELEDMKNLDNDLSRRLSEAEKNLADLQTEKEELKAKRPVLLADNADVAALNNRLKEIDEAMELNQDTITGIKDKRKKMHNPILYKIQDTNGAYKDYINEILAKKREDYMKIAPKLAELLKDYITLEYMRDRDCSGRAYFTTEDIMTLPNCNDEKHPLFYYHYYTVADENRERVKEKYKLPEYDMRRVEWNHFIR